MSRQSIFDPFDGTLQHKMRQEELTATRTQKCPQCGRERISQASHNSTCQTIECTVIGYQRKIQELESIIARWQMVIGDTLEHREEMAALEEESFKRILLSGLRKTDGALD